VRRATDPAAAATALRPELAKLAAANRLELREGRLVFELRPPIAIDKGKVIDRLVVASSAHAVLFTGDDLTDVDGFTALRRWRARGLQTMAVAVRSSEAAPALFADADLVVDGVDGVMQLLGALAASLV
jgi:trehalose 6-phosphate phosphatase